jgi:hypothetical protein
MSGGFVRVGMRVLRSVHPAGLRFWFIRAKKSCTHQSSKGFQEALLLKGLKIVFKDHGNAPLVSFDVISLSRWCRMDPV